MASTGGFGSSLWARLGGVAAMALAVAGCAAPATTQQTARYDIVHDQAGFTIIEEARIGSDLRYEYDAALALLEQQQYRRGIAGLVGVTGRAPHVTAPWIDLGIAYGRTGDLQRAADSLEKALALNPDHPVALNEIGMIYRKTGRFAQARQSYERALAVHPGFHFARRNLAILCDLYLGDLDCALENYERYRLAVPDDDEPVMWIADLRNRANRQSSR
ncbi:MAG: tetratricopeptide repeat protein [Pseudomonadales bacterium]